MSDILLDWTKRAEEAHRRLTGKVSEQFIQRALQWASERWCWDDEAAIRELCFIHDTHDDPTELVDQFAEGYGLDDPCADWGPRSSDPPVRAEYQLIGDES